MRRPVPRGVRRLTCLLVLVALSTSCSGDSTGYAPLDGAEIAISDDRLVVSGSHGACDSLGETEVTESATEVRIRVPLRVRRGDCRSIGLLLQVEVTLEAPLEDRVVVDAERGQTLPVRRG